MAAWRGADPRSLEPAAAAAVLETIAKERPADPEPLRNMAAAQMAAGDASAAQTSLRRAITLAPGRADLWSALGEAFMAESQGEMSPDARAAFAQALVRDPTEPAARYHIARARIAAGDVSGGLAQWRAVLAGLAADDPRRGGLQGEIAAVEKTGALAAPQAEGPSEADLSGAIGGMVAGLAARLEASPDDPQGWARLIRAYAVLGDAAKRDAALAKARRIFAGRPDMLRTLDAASQGPQ